jgi:hypothetical protein
MFYFEGLLAKMKRKNQTDNKNFTCPNPKCNKEFTSPITVYDLSSANTDKYDGCPYCLTAIETAEDSDNDEKEQELEINGNKIDKVRSFLMDANSESNKNPSPQKCPKHFGYLNQRSRGEKTPEECMSCPKLIECMLKQSA